MYICITKKNKKMKNSPKMNEKVVVTIDNKKLEAGSYVRCNIGNIGVVRQFFLSEESVLLVKVSLDERIEIAYPIHKLELLDKDSVFETEDGFKITEGDNVYWVYKCAEGDYRRITSTTITKSHRALLSKEDPIYFIFAHAHNAEEFVDSKNKRFSIADIKKAYDKTNPKGSKVSHSFAKLIEQLKSS